MTPRYYCLVADTVTGAILDELPITGFNWSDSLDMSRVGSMTVDVSLTGTNTGSEMSRRNQAKSVASGPWKNTLVLMRDAAALWAGPLVTYSVSATSVTFGCTGLAKLFGSRLVIGPGYELNPGSADANITLMLDQPSVASYLLNLGSTGSGRTLPLTIPGSTGVGGDYRQYLAIDLASVYERLSQLTQEAGGPDVVITPQVDISQRFLTWVALIGQPRLGRQTDSPLAWDMPGPARQITVDGDGANMASRTYTVGDSQNDPRPVGIATDLTRVSYGAPVLEVSVRDNSSIREQTLLDRHAQASATANRDPAISWQITVDPDADPTIDLWNFGDNAQLTVSGHPWIDDGTYWHRVIGWTHTPGTAVLQTTSMLDVI